MCSTIDQLATASAVARLAALVAHRAEVDALIAEQLRDPAVASAVATSATTGEDGDQDAAGDAALDAATGRVDVGALPPDVAAELAVSMLRSSDRTAAAASVLVGHVVATTGPGTGTLIGGRYASARRWLEVEARLAPASARAVLGRARDLREQPPVIRDEWLTGRVSGDAVRELTVGVRSMLRPVKAPRAEKELVRDEAIDLLMPVAHAGTPEDMKLALAKMRVISNPDGATQAQMEAYDDQSLTCIRVGDMSVLTVHLTHENAAAVMTVVDAYARRICDRDPDVVHDPTCPLHAPAPAKGDNARRWCSCGASAAAGVTSKDRWPHLQAVAFTEVFTGFLDDGQVGSHHRVARHVTVQVDAAELAAGIGGTLTIPGQDAPLVLPPETIRRMLCDASITPVVVERLRTLDPGSCADGLATLLSQAGVLVLYVGRSERTVTPRMRQAVVARDRHCVFPCCRANPRRCEAHHVTPWEHGGPTDLDNLALLCVRHHHAVHEGGWNIQLKAGATGHETGCWEFTPPRPQP